MEYVRMDIYQWFWSNYAIKEMMICILTINSRTKRHEININGDGTKTNREIKKNNDWRT